MFFLRRLPSWKEGWMWSGLFNVQIQSKLSDICLCVPNSLCSTLGTSYFAQWVTFFCLNVLLKYSWFTMLCWFLLHSKVIQLYACFFNILFHYSLSCGYSSLCSMVGRCYLSILHIKAYVCQPQPSSPSPPFLSPWRPAACSLCLWVCFCFVDMFVCVIF